MNEPTHTTQPSETKEMLEGVFIHVSMSSPRPDLVVPEVVTVDAWIDIALQWYGVYYTYYDPHEDEWDEHFEWVDKWRKWLTDNVPPQLKDGVHLIGPESGFMGEDIYVADNEITHTIHAVCDKCKNFELVWRNGGTRIWCCSCNAYSTRASQLGDD